MAYSEQLADRVRAYLAEFPKLQISEKPMFGALAFMVNGKMCINVSGDRLMCRFDPDLKDEVSQRAGYEITVMRGREMKGFCYVQMESIKTRSELESWVDLCLDFNDRAKVSGKQDSRTA